jgi:hypothetical protein
MPASEGKANISREERSSMQHMLPHKVPTTRSQAILVPQKTPRGCRQQQQPTCHPVIEHACLSSTQLWQLDAARSHSHHVCCLPITQPRVHTHTHPQQQCHASLGTPVRVLSCCATASNLKQNPARQPIMIQFYHPIIPQVKQQEFQEPIEPGRREPVLLIRKTWCHNKPYCSIGETIRTMMVCTKTSRAVKFHTHNANVHKLNASQSMERPKQHLLT